MQKYQTHNSCRQTWVPRWFRDLLVAYITECNSFFGINHFHSVDRKLSFQFLKPARVYSFFIKKDRSVARSQNPIKILDTPQLRKLQVVHCPEKRQGSVRFFWDFQTFSGLRRQCPPSTPGMLGRHCIFKPFRQKLMSPLVVAFVCSCPACIRPLSWLCGWKIS